MNRSASPRRIAQSFPSRKGHRGWGSKTLSAFVAHLFFAWALISTSQGPRGEGNEPSSFFVAAKRRGDRSEQKNSGARGVDRGATTHAAESICACSPPELEFTLDFSLPCLRKKVTDGPSAGIDDVACTTFAESLLEEDLVPVEVNSIGVLELGLDSKVIKQVSSRFWLPARQAASIDSFCSHLLSLRIVIPRDAATVLQEGSPAI